MKKEIWEQFCKWGSAFRLEAERDYKKRGEPLIFHLFMFGLYFPENYELVGKNLEKLMKRAMKDGNKEMKKMKLKQKALRQLGIR